MDMASTTHHKENAMNTIPSAIPSIAKNDRLRDSADQHIARATPKRQALAIEWIAVSIILDERGQHIRADKAIMNALYIAGGTTPMRDLPSTLAWSWVN